MLTDIIGMETKFESRQYLNDAEKNGDFYKKCYKKVDILTISIGEEKNAGEISWRRTRRSIPRAPS